MKQSQFSHRIQRPLLCLVSLVMLLSCHSGSANGMEDEYYKQVNLDLQERIQLLKSYPTSNPLARQLQLLMDQPQDEKALALRFLYAYMPLNDLAEQSFDYYNQQVEQAFRTKDMPWGKDIPQELFRHFVLPPRVNNESLDNARDLFYQELAPLVKGMSMKDAVLEVNHWCRQKVVYQPTDSRTTPPSQVVARAYGRCGEESVVAVAALRSIGIPARQVYVPRWAHTDDNHAWVEVWVDGVWHYLGACEPEPDLDRGWFTSASSRAMLVNTWAFGPLTPNAILQGEVISSNACFTELSSIDQYAPTRKAVVKITDKNGQPLEGATVAFNVYNYSELFPLSVRTTNSDGIAVLTTGKGTLLIEASLPDPTDSGHLLYAICPFPLQDTLKMVLEEPLAPESTWNFTLTPPAESTSLAALDPQTAQMHNQRCSYDDSLRTLHTSDFLFNNPQKVTQFCDQLEKRGLSKAKSTTLAQLLAQSLSNGESLQTFFTQTSDAHLPLAVDLLSTLRVKDLQEVSPTTLTDYLDGVTLLGDAYKDTPIWRDYVLNPRIGDEVPLPYKAFLGELLNSFDARVEASLLEKIAALLGQYPLLPEWNPRQFPTTPAATAKLGLADPLSIEILGIALFRTAGIPARKDPVSGAFQFWQDGKWQDMNQEESTPKATFTLSWPSSGKKDPAYDTRYTIGQWEASAGASTPFYRTLGFAYESGGVSGTQVLNTPLTLNPGNYRILSGVRLADGSVLAQGHSFQLTPNEKKTLPLTFTPVDNQLAVISHFNISNEIIDAIGRGFFVLAILDATKEPSQHFIRELSEMSEWKLPSLFQFSDELTSDFFKKQNYHLPTGRFVFSTNAHDALLDELSNALEVDHLQEKLPVVIVADSFGNIYYQSVGYRIGIPKTIADMEIPGL